MVQNLHHCQFLATLLLLGSPCFVHLTGSSKPKHKFVSRWMSVELICYVKRVNAF